MSNRDHDILGHLSQCRPYKLDRKKHPLLALADKFHRWLFSTGVTIGGLGIVMGIGIKRHVAPEWLLTPALLTLFGGVLLTLLAPAVSTTVEIIRALRWKRESLDFLREEIKRDEQNLQPLLCRSEHELQIVLQYLKTKVDRIDRQVAKFFGSGAALFSLEAVAYQFVKDLGGLTWFVDTFEKGLKPGNYVNAILLAGFALVIGLAFGAIMLKASQRRFAYQVDLVELTLLLKSQATERRKRRSSLRRDREPRPLARENANFRKVERLHRDTGQIEHVPITALSALAQVAERGKVNLQSESPVCTRPPSNSEHLA
ncbi:hypothetical protein ATN79_45065 [Paraburkholderia caribensis]|nr:hypothetical protein ATN79_45065 [Paraburkholderia caribensis]